MANIHKYELAPVIREVVERKTPFLGICVGLQLLFEKSDEAEAYWGMVLSEFGVEYVEDPESKKRIPTCHRTTVKSISANENYKSALKYADIESQAFYEDEAEIIDSLQKKILNASAPLS